MIDLTCTNGDHPHALPFGAPDGDLLNENENLAGPIAMLRRASPSVAWPRGQRALWRLIAGMTPHAQMLEPSGVAAVKDLLRLHVAGVPRAMPQIEAIVGLNHRPVMQWMAVQPMSTFVRGIEIHLTVDESAFSAFSLRIFSEVMDRLFAPHTSMNGFVQLVVRAMESGRELRRCPPRLGTTQLLGQAVPFIRLTAHWRFASARPPLTCPPPLHHPAPRAPPARSPAA